MIDEILNLPSVPSSFNIEDEKKKFIEYGGTLPEYFEGKNGLTKDEVIEIINSKRFSNKVELLAILFWGIYFKVMARSPKSIASVVEFIQSDSFKNKMNKRKNAIINSSNPKSLFKKFDGHLKVPGLGYAYFTKLFFFYRQALVPEGQTFLILDKWLSNAWCAIEGSKNSNTEVFDRFYKAKTDHWFDGTLKRKKPEAYKSYLDFMDTLRNGLSEESEHEISLIDLEEKLFGSDLKQNPYDNPRVLYRKWAEKQSIPLTKPKSIDEKLSKEVIAKEESLKEVPNSFFLNKTKNYEGLYTSANNKEGYIDSNGWLCVSEHLKSLLDSYTMTWDEGNTKGGSKEKYKTKFKNQDEGIEFLKVNGFIKLSVN